MQKAKPPQDDELTAFLRIGTDFTQNYYEIQIPLKMSPDGSLDPRDVWPLENEIDLEMDALYQLKSLRNRMNADINLPFPQEWPANSRKARLFGYWVTLICPQYMP